MKYFNFDNLINKYSVEFTLLSESKGYHNEVGDWVTGKPIQVKKQGAIIGISENKIYRSDGVLTEKDKELYMRQSLGDITKSYVIHGGNKYHVEQNPNNNSTFTGVWQYTLKWVSVFEEGDTND